MINRPAPAVTILLPTHNRADVLGFAVQSVLAQTWTDFELLVAGDGCSDETAAVMRAFEDARVSWHDLPKAPGVGYANRNIVLRQARGQLIAYLAHDDLWLHDHLERLVELFRDETVEFVYSQPLDVSMAGDITPIVFNLHDRGTAALWRANQQGYVSLSNVIHRQACFGRYGGWNEKLPRRGDRELWLKLIDGGRRQNFVYLPVPTSLHFVANWRRASTETWRRKLWRRVRIWEGSALPELKVVLRAGQTEQEAAWRAMSQAPEAWARTVRRAAQVDVDRRSGYAFRPSDVLEFAFRSFRRWSG